MTIPFEMIYFEGPCWFEGGYLMTSGHCHRQIIWSWKNIRVDRSRGGKWRFTMENFQSLHLHQGFFSRFATLFSFCWENCFSFWQRAWCKSTFWWTTNVMCHYRSKVQIGLLLAPKKKLKPKVMKVFGADFVLEGIFRLVTFRRCMFLRCQQPQWQDKRLSMDQSAMAGPGISCRTSRSFKWTKNHPQ